MSRSRSSSTSSVQNAPTTGPTAKETRRYRSASRERRGPPGGFRMSTGGRAMAKWLEAKQKQYFRSDDEEAFSIVTSGDEIPVQDRKDSSYRGRRPARSRIASAQALRNEISPIRTRRSKRPRTSSPHAGQSDNDYNLDEQQDHPATEAATRGDGRHSSPHTAPPPTVPKDNRRNRRSKKVKSAAIVDSEDEFARPASSTTKRGRQTSKKARREALPSPPSRLSTDIDVPTMTDILEAARQGRIPAPEARSRRAPSPFIRFFDDEAIEDDAPQPSDDEMRDCQDENDYDYADSFIDDGEESDVSMKNAQLDEKKGRRHPTSRLRAPSEPEEDDDDGQFTHRYVKRSDERPYEKKPNVVETATSRRYSERFSSPVKPSTTKSSYIHRGKTFNSAYRDALPHESDDGAPSRLRSPFMQDRVSQRRSKHDRAPPRSRSTREDETHVPEVRTSSSKYHSRSHAPVGRHVQPDTEVLEISSESSGPENDDHRSSAKSKQRASTSNLPEAQDSSTKSKPRPRPRPLPRRAPATDAPAPPPSAAPTVDRPTTPPPVLASLNNVETDAQDEAQEYANIFKDDVLTPHERELMLHALFISRQEAKQSGALAENTANDRTGHSNTSATPATSTSKDKGKARALRSPSPKPVNPPSSSKNKGKGRAKRSPSPFPNKTEDLDKDLSDEELSAYERMQLRQAMDDSRRLADSPRTPGETSTSRNLSGSSGSSSASQVPPPSSPVSPSPSRAAVTMADLLALVEAAPNPSGASQAESDAAADDTVTPHPFVEDMTTTRRCRVHPTEDATVRLTIRDPVLARTYRGLCNLNDGRLVPWMDAVGRGQINFSVWGEWLPHLNAAIAFDCVTFTDEGPIRNPARTCPLNVAMRTVPGSNQRFNFYCATNPPVPLVAVSCGWLERSQLVAPSETGIRQKYITVIFHTQEWERTVGFIRTTSGYPELQAQLARDALQFSTRPQSSRPPTSPGDSAGRKGRSAPSKMFANRNQGASATVAGDNFSLANDATVPVYDARNMKSLDFHAVLPNLAKSLPLYTGGEIPQGSFVMVGYTMTVYRANSGYWTLGCNIQWVILIGAPED